MVDLTAGSLAQGNSDGSPKWPIYARLKVLLTNTSTDEFVGIHRLSTQIGGEGETGVGTAMQVEMTAPTDFDGTIEPGKDATVTFEIDKFLLEPASPFKCKGTIGIVSTTLIHASGQIQVPKVGGFTFDCAD